MTTCCQPIPIPASDASCGLRVCAWCEKVMGPAVDLLPGEVTHGICPVCVAKVKGELP